MKLRKIQWWRESNQWRQVCQISVVAARTITRPLNNINTYSIPLWPIIRVCNKFFSYIWLTYTLIPNECVFLLCGHLNKNKLYLSSKKKSTGTTNLRILRYPKTYNITHTWLYQDKLVIHRKYLTQFSTNYTFASNVAYVKQIHYVI